MPQTKLFPADLKALTTLRFFAALWIVAYHFRPYFGLSNPGIPFFDKGYLAVDFFFMLSGFVLAHVYRRSIAAGAFSYFGFLQRRIARIYPMHIVTLAFFMALAAMAAFGVKIDSAKHLDPLEVVRQLLLVHAWTGTGLQLNTPAWSISAEFFAYLCFPLVMLLAPRPRLMLACGLLATFGWYWGAKSVAGDVSTHILDWRLMRIMPEFLLGAALREILERRSLPFLTAPKAAPVAAALVLVLAAAGAPDWIALIALMALLVAAAERARSGAHGALETPFGLWLGEISYALYMVHLGVGMVFFEAAQRLFGEQPAFSVPHIALGILGVGAAIVTAALAERYVERPGRALIQSIRLRRVEA